MGFLRLAKWVVSALIVLVAAAVLHYTLPDRDVARIVDTEVRRVDPGPISRFFWASPARGTAPVGAQRDVRFISTILTDGTPMVYRNEDTGWGWPPYLKFDTSNLQTRAVDLVSTAEDPQWVVIRHYGWRSTLLSIYPNAVGLRPVPGPDPDLFPWLKILILIGLALILATLWRLWRRFKEDMIDPLIRHGADR